MIISYYDQIRLSEEREQTLFGFGKPSITSDKYVPDYERLRSEKHKETLREMEDRIKQYTYRV